VVITFERRFRLASHIGPAGRQFRIHRIAEALLWSSPEAVAYVGLNPRWHQSGTSIDRVTRISKIGNSVLRTALYMPAMSAMQYNLVIIALVTRLKSRGRLKPKQIVVAAMRKLLVLCFGVPKTGKPFDPAIAMGGC
jgi:transposase